MITQHFSSPANWQDFETFMKDFFNEKYGGGFDRYGTTGQNQSGVDIIGVYKGRNIGIQCKKIEKKLAQKTLIKEIEKADKFVPQLDKYIIATTDKRNAIIQSELIKINSDRVDNGLCYIEIMSWETVEEEINGNILLQKKYYDEILSKIDNEYVYKHILSTMEKAFNRPAFTTDFYCEGNISHFVEAIMDLHEFLNTGRLRSRDGEYISGTMSYKNLKYNDDITDGDNICKNIQEIRNLIERGKRDNTIRLHGNTYCADRDFSDKINKKRKKVISLLNEIFQRYGKKSVLLPY